MKTERSDIHTLITDQIIAAIEAGAGEFRCPWHRSSGNIMRPKNIASKKSYNGVNILALWATADQKGYASGLWGTYRQWREIGAQVRQGEKAASVVFFKDYDVEPKDEADDGKRLVARASFVFSAEQVDGFEASQIDAPPAVIRPLEAAERFIAATGAQIAYGGERAFYQPSTDKHPASAARALPWHTDQHGRRILLRHGFA